MFTENLDVIKILGSIALVLFSWCYLHKKKNEKNFSFKALKHRPLRYCKIFYIPMLLDILKQHLKFYAFLSVDEHKM